MTVDNEPYDFKSVKRLIFTIYWKKNLTKKNQSSKIKPFNGFTSLDANLFVSTIIETFSCRSSRMFNADVRVMQRKYVFFDLLSPKQVMSTTRVFPLHPSYPYSRLHHTFRTYRFPSTLISWLSRHYFFSRHVQKISIKSLPFSLINPLLLNSLIFLILNF